MTPRHLSLRLLPLPATGPLRAVVLFALAAAVWLLGTTASQAQVSFTGSYAENFDSMGTSGTAAPAGWTVYGNLGGDKDSWTAATGIPASGSPSAASGSANATLIAREVGGAPGTSNTQGYNIALSSATSDRALGTSPTSGAGLALQLRLVNNTGAALSSLRISYDIRRFTTVSTAEALPGYRLFASSDSGATWTNVEALNQTLATVPSSSGVSSIAATTIALPSPVANGSEIRLRWIDDNGPPSPDQVIGLDNVVIVLPQPAPEVTLTAPADGASYDLPATVELAADASDSNGTVTKVEFFANGAKIGEDTSAPYTFSWSGMISGTYSLTAVATDNDGGSTTSDAVGITIVNPDNQLPSVTLVSPENGAQIAGSSTTLAATATDSDGVVAKVEFYEGTNKLGEDSTAPYTWQWTGAVTGTYSVTARAIDNDGGFTDSVPASVTFVVPVESTLITRRPGSSPGTVWKYLDDGTDQGTAWREPGFDDSTWQSGPAKLGYSDSPNTTLREGPGGMTSSVKFITYYFRRTFEVAGAGAVQAIVLNILRDDGAVVYINGVEVARQNMPEGPIDYLTHSSTITDGSNESTYFTSTVTELPPLNEGINHIAVEVHQRDQNSSDLGFDLELTTVSLPGTPPAIELTSPVDGATYTAPATVAFAADATDSDGSVVKVEFFNGDEKLGEDTEAPFAFDWTVVPQGDYVLTARATDNYGLTATSDPVHVSVGAPDTVFPTVTVTSPADGAEFLDPATIEIAATAADADGSVVKVEFFEGSNKLGEVTSAPYAFTWSGVPAGTYTITARATDNLTAATVSAPVTVTVNPNLPPQITLAAPADGAIGLGGSGTVNLVANVSDPEGQPLDVTFYGRPKSAPPGEDFTLVTLPDTQFYSENSGGTRFQHFTNQTNWIVSSRTALNTVFVAHMGDMVNTSSQAQEWTNAKQAMDIIENPVTTSLLHGMPWGGAPGNHDGTGSEWDTHFGPSRFAGRDYYQGNYNNSNRNNYQFFSAGGMDFIVVNLAYNSSTSGNAAVLDWADALLKAHPNRRAIVTSHWLVGVSFPPTQAAWGGHGQAVYNKLRENPNLFLMLCGHIHGEGRRFDVYEGRTVNTVLQDYQSRSNGGDSWLRYYTFKPSENRIHAYTYQTRTGNFETDADSQFTLDYDMTATAPWSELGTVNLTAGETSATLPWTGLSNGEEYEWYAAVSDGVTPVGSGTNSFTASGNAAPSITLDAPADGSTTTRPAAVEFAATASDPDGTIDRVEFYHGTTKIGEDDTAPYTFSWEAPSGVHAVSARAIDGEGAHTDSATATVTVDVEIAPSITGGGSVTGSGGYLPGSNAAFEAHANPGYGFAGWRVDGAPAGADPVLELVATEGMVIEAEFVPQLLITEIQSNQASSGKDDFWELTNIGSQAIDLGGWKWDDDSRNPNDAAAVTIPSGTVIAPGESIVFTPLSAAAFRSWWGLPASVQVVTGGPSFGGNDSVSLFDPAGVEVRYLSYAAGGFTRSDGSPSAGGHAGVSAGGTATQSVVWDPVHGTVHPRYKAATAGNTGAFASAESALDVGSPGYAGVAPALLITEIQSNQASSGKDDFWELTNIGSQAIDLGGWKWDDDSRNPNDAAAVTIPSGTVIAPGESIVFTPLSAAAFRSWWGLPASVQVVTGGPSFGGNDSVSLFDPAGVEVRYLSYAAGGFTRSDGSPSTGGHAGLSAGGSATQSMIWDSVHGTVNPHYKAATVGDTGAFASAESALDVGSPGYSGYSIAPSLTLRLGGSTIASGGVATLQVEASGLPEPTLQWYYGAAGDTGNPVVGATSPTLVTGPLGSTTEFWVRASNIGGDFDSGTITVTVVPKAVSIDLSNYVRVGRYGLPEPIRTALPSGTPAHNLLCQEASGVAYNPDTDTLFIVGDGGRSVTQVSKTGVLIDTMTLALGSSPQGTEFYDIEGIAYIGGGEFVMSEERDRRLVKFTYAAGTTLTRAMTQGVKIGTYVDNTGTEDVTFDPITGGYICIKEISPLGIFQTDVDFAAGTASNGSPSTVNSTDLFDPALAGMSDFAGVFALANLPGFAGQPQESHLLLLGQEDGRLVIIDRAGAISSTLQIAVSSGDTVSVGEQQHEGVTMDAAGFLYIVNENGGGGIDYPELWVYAPSDSPNSPPTGLTLNGAVTELMENTPTLAPIQLGVIAVEDDGLGVNGLSLAGPDAAFFEIVGSTLYLKAGTVLDFETKSSYSITIQVDDPSVGTSPDASHPYTLTVLDQEPESIPLPSLLITEVAPWSSGDSPVGADWFEVTNVSESPIDLSGWKVDDSSKNWANAVALNGVATIAPGESVIFIETGNLAATSAAFLANWFGANPPTGLQIGSYSGSGIGLSTGGDEVWLFDASGQLHSGVAFGSSPSGPQLPTFDNTAGLNDTTIGKLSVSGENGAFRAAGSPAEVGSPGYAAPGRLIITEVAPWSSGNSPLGEDWFEVTNVGARVVSIAGWKMDDSSESPVAAVPLQGIYSIAPGESVIFIETNDLAAKSAAFLDLWFGTNPPAGLQIGSYSGSGVGLSTGGDAVNLYDTNHVRRANLSFGQSPSSAPYGTFDNSALRENATVALFSMSGVNGAFAAANDPSEVGSPGSLHLSLESILVESRGGEVTASGSLAIGGTAHFTATASPGFTFRGWRVNGELSSETSSTLSTTVTAGLQVEALFAYTLQLLHLADGEAGLLASETAPYLAALVEAFEGDHDHTLIVSGGDNFIPGPFLGAGTDPSLDTVAAVGRTGFARPDIAIHNLIGVEASAIGNHEWDLGSNVFMDAIRNDGAWIGAQFPYISSNLDYSGDSAANGRFTDVPLDGAATAVPDASDLKTRLVPVAVVDKGGEKIGLVGVTTQILRNISSPSGTLVKGYPAGTPGADDMDLLATHVQPYIDELIAEGIDKIVLLSHLQQIANEQLLATKLRDVDIVLAAGSNTRLGDADDVAVAFPGHDADFAGSYPILTSGLDGKPTLVVCTDNEYTYLGRLVVDFDENGEILVDSLDGRLPVNGAYASTAENVATAWGVAEAALGSTAFAPGTKGAAVKEVVDAVQSVIHAKDGDIKGYTSVYLEGERNHVRSEETNFGSLTADANAWALRRILDDGTPVVSLKNGGGIRAQIGSIDVATGEKLPPAANAAVGKPSGAISQLDIENALRFNNRLMVFDTTPQGLKALLEHGVAAGTLQGRFPQVGGVIFAWDPALPAGERVTSIALAGESGQPREAVYGDGVFSPWAPPVIRLVTLNFMANDGDGYPSKANGSHFRYLLDDGTLSDPVDPSEDFTAASTLPGNTMGEQQAFVELLQDRHATPEEAFDVADTAAADDLRIQNLAFRTNAVPVDLSLLLGGDGTAGVGPEEIEAGGSRGFRFQLSDRRLVGISAPGSEGLVAELLDAAGNVVATFPGNGPIAFNGILGAGDYLLRITNPGGQSKSLSLAMAAGAVPTPRPDVAVGASLGKLRGRGVYSPASQRVTLASRKLRVVRAVAEVTNRSTLPDAMKVKASRSNKLFRVAYTSGGRNATAALVAGSFTTAGLKADSASVVVSAKVAPQKKRLQVKRGGKSRILKKTYAVNVSAVSVSSPGLSDAARLQVRTR